MSLRDVQARLVALGYPIAVDNAYGPQTERALLSALAKLPDASVLPPQELATRPINEIVIHCTATREGQDFGAADIRRWHLANGWNDIGYHYVVRLDGTVEAGRPESVVGAHVSGHNAGTLGVVYVGGVSADGETPRDTRTAAQKANLAAVCRALIQRYPAITRITGHNQHNPAKACPSFRVDSDALALIPHRF